MCYKGYRQCSLEKLYAQVSVKEIEFQISNTSNTYFRVFKPNADIIKSNQTISEKKLKLNLSNDDKRLSHMYWVPNLHKHATGSRFIIDAPKCFVKPFSNALTSVLRLLFKKITAYNDKCNFSPVFTPLGQFLIIS